jgi:hypothetical protein
MGTDVAWEKRWVSFVEEITGLSVYNISTGGICPSQALRLYERYGELAGVSVVLLGVYGINDLGDERNFHRFLESGMSVKAWSYQRARNAWSGRTFGFLQLIRYHVWKRKDKLLPGDASPPEELGPVTVANTRAVEKVSYYPNYQDRAFQCATADLATYPAAMNLVSSLVKLNSLCQRQKRQLAVLYFPIKQTIHPPSSYEQQAWLEFLTYAVPPARPENWSKERISRFGQVLLKGDERFAEHLSLVCDSLDVPFHSLIPALKNAVSQTGELHYYHFDTHWNARGHACVGESIANWLRTVVSQKPD